MSEDKAPDKATAPGDGTTPPETPPGGQVAGQGKDEPLPPELHATLTRMRQDDARETQRQREDLARQREELAERMDKLETPDSANLPEGVDLGALDKVVTQIPGFKAMHDELQALRGQVHRNALSSGMDALKGQPFLDEVRGDMADSLQGAAQIDRNTVEAAYRYHAQPKLAARLAELEAEKQKAEADRRASLAAAGVGDTGGMTSGGVDVNPHNMTEEELEAFVANVPERERMASLGLVPGPD